MTPKPCLQSASTMQNTISEFTIKTAAENIAGVLRFAFEHDPTRTALVVADSESELARALTSAYRSCLSGAKFIDFEKSDRESIRQEFERLSPGDLVVLIQSTSFRLDAFRIRIELFNRSLKVIEHPHLARMSGAEAVLYIDSLAYDRHYFRTVGHALKQRIDRAETGVVESGDGELVFPAGFESAKLNIGDYGEMKNIGGQYPIGEVFTESADLGAVHGEILIALFGDRTFTVNRPKRPISLSVEQGRVVGVANSNPEFDQVLADIRADEGEVWLRELGLGLNRAFSLAKTVCDIGSFERMCGVHLSLGRKHTIYKKPDFKKKTTRHHVDVFVATKRVLFDDTVVFQDGAWIEPSQP